MKEKLRVVVDAKEEVIAKGLKSPLERVVEANRKVIEMEVDSLSDQLQFAYAAIVKAVADLPQKSEGVQLENVTFSLVVDSRGSVSLFSALSAESKSQVGLTFTVSVSRNQT